ncbi:hypothetical protein HG536_0D01440 [Torulaspora globosa]|uniref:Uncharacterized protein n=1 Tax=Torulaspora globosa TaxID=48254 RepID=A0A7G3ZGI6_9SACH|nr:uncharacterized protein HG536_0D01440 [Torulaspora globosa]QLL32622.1 hypothetical protein HG536_0D01440 [Torulaspora globosa]
MVDIESYVPMIDAILSASNPDEVTPKRIRKALQELFGVNLNSQRKAVNQLIVERFQEVQSRPKVLVTQEELLKRDEALAHSLHLEEKAAAKKSRSPKVRKSRKGERNPPKNNNLVSRKLELMEPLRGFLGETMLPRTEVVKKLWDYIKENELQNPQDRREIICDSQMEPIFGKKMTMFSMNKLLSKYLKNPENDATNPIKEDPSSGNEDLAEANSSGEDSRD